MRLRVGTSGYSYPEWKGTFYPERLAAKDMLRFYAGRFGTVEVNNTFYRMPAEATLARWRDEVPDDFAFVLKASRRITHDRKLQGVEDPVAYFVRTSAALGGKLGPLLFQLPPTFKKDLPRLTEFLRLVPRGRRIAVEFRHPSWLEDDVYAALRERDAALCVADTDAGEVPLVSTAGWGYLRLRRQDYADGELADWARRIRAEPWADAFVFFKHEDEGRGPKLAARFVEIAG